MTVVRFPKPRRQKAEPGDLLVFRERARPQQPTAWAVLLIAEVDDEGFVTTVVDVDGKRIAAHRVTDAYASKNMVCPAATLTPEGLRQLPGLAAPDVETLKAEFRKFDARGLS